MTTFDSGPEISRNQENTPPPQPQEPLLTMLTAALRRHRRVVWLVGILVLLPGALFAWRAGAPRYLAEARLHVAPSFPKTLEQDDEIQSQAYDYHAFLSQQVHLLKRYEVLEDALRRLGPGRTLWQHADESDGEAIDRLAEQLVAEPVPSSFLLAVSLEAGQPDGVAEIVNAVADAYLEAQRAESFFEPDERIEDLRAHRAEVQAQIAQRMQQQGELALDLGFTGLDAQSGNSRESQLANAAGLLAEARTELLVARAERRALDGAESLQVAIAHAGSAPSGASATGTSQQSLLQRREEIQSQMAGLTEQHPGHRAYARQLERVETLLLEEARASADARVALAQQQLDALQVECDALTQATFGHASEHAVAEENAQVIAADQQRLSEIDRRINFLELESGGPGFARLFSRARTPEQPTRDRRLKYLIAVCLFAAGAGVGAGLLAHSLDRRIHTSDDLERLLGFPPIVTLRHASLRPDDDGDELANPIRRLALCIEREHRRNGTGVFVVTATHANSWTGTLVARVARELSAMNQQVLTVDANLTVHPRGQSHAGLIDVLKGNTEVGLAVVPGTPSHLPLGNGSGYQRLPYGHRFASVLGTLSPTNDIVLIDAPPILQSVDAELFVDADQATLLVVSADLDTSDEVRRAMQTLRSLSPRAFGVVLDHTLPAHRRRNAHDGAPVAGALIATAGTSGGSSQWT